MKSATYIKIDQSRIRAQMTISFDRLGLRPTQAVPGVGKREDASTLKRRIDYANTETKDVISSVSCDRSDKPFYEA